MHRLARKFASAPSKRVVSETFAVPASRLGKAINSASSLPVPALKNGRAKTGVPPEVAEKLAEHVMYPELTERELEVLRLMATGKTNREVGGALFITEGTVKAHVNNILTKMGVRDRTQAVTTALKRGLVQLD